MEYYIRNYHQLVCNDQLLGDQKMQELNQIVANNLNIT